MESKTKKRYVVYYDKENHTIYADYVIEHYEINRMTFFLGKPDYIDMGMNPLVASFPLDKSAIIQVTNY
jgi:hypothetical protein